jgi:hypothetical protein
MLDSQIYLNYHIKGEQIACSCFQYYISKEGIKQVAELHCVEIEGTELYSSLLLIRPFLLQGKSSLVREVAFLEVVREVASLKGVREVASLKGVREVASLEGVRQVASLEGDNLVVFYHLSTSEI